MLHFCIPSLADVDYKPRDTKEHPLNTQNSTPLGFSWDPSVLPQVNPGSTRRALAIYQQQLASFVWDAAKLENNPFTFVEVQTLLDGVTVGGHKLSDAEQVTNLADSSKKLVELVKSGRFDLDKPTIVLLHSIIARNEALELGVFRGEDNILSLCRIR